LLVITSTNLYRSVCHPSSQGNCTFREDPSIFNCTYPSGGNPYLLDLSEPYKAAVLEELMVSIVEWVVWCGVRHSVLRTVLGWYVQGRVHL